MSKTLPGKLFGFIALGATWFSSQQCHKLRQRVNSWAKSVGRSYLYSLQLAALVPFFLVPGLRVSLGTHSAAKSISLGNYFNDTLVANLSVSVPLSIAAGDGMRTHLNEFCAFLVPTRRRSSHLYLSFFFSFISRAIYWRSYSVSPYSR